MSAISGSRHLAAQRCSGLSVAAYCRKVGVSKNSFYYWRKRLRVGSASTVQSFPHAPFTEIRFPLAASAPSYSLRLHTGDTLDVPRAFDRVEVADLLTLLRAEDGRWC